MLNTLYLTNGRGQKATTIHYPRLSPDKYGQCAKLNGINGYLEKENVVVQMYVWGVFCSDAKFPLQIILSVRIQTAYHLYSNWLEPVYLLYMLDISITNHFPHILYSFTINHIPGPSYQHNFYFALPKFSNLQM